MLTFLQFCLERTVDPDYKMPQHGRLKEIVSAEARTVGEQSAILQQEALTVLGAHLPHGAAPPASAFVMLYSTTRNGFSVATLVSIHGKLVAARKLLRDGLLFIIKDTNSNVFGFFVSVQRVHFSLSFGVVDA